MVNEFYSRCESGGKVKKLTSSDISNVTKDDLLNMLKNKYGHGIFFFMSELFNQI